MSDDDAVDKSGNKSQPSFHRPAYGILKSGKTTRSKAKKLKLLIATVTVVAIASTVTVILLWHRSTSNDINLQSVKERVGRHYLLPANEEPALATIVDKTKVNTELFKQAQNDDRVLIYQKNRIAIIYRPSIDRIIAVGPVTIDAPKSGVQ